MKNLLVALDLTQEEIEIFKSIPDVALTVKSKVRLQLMMSRTSILLSVI